jgi:hypothetical protein
LYLSPNGDNVGVWMTIEIYPRMLSESDPRGQVRKLIEELQCKQPRLFALVDSTIRAIERANSLQFLTEAGKEEPVRGCAEPIRVLKLPPKGVRGGVVRIYFCYDLKDAKKLWLLSAELKTEKKDDPVKIKAAIDRYRELG